MAAFTEGNIAREKNIADLLTARRSQDQQRWSDLAGTLNNLAGVVGQTKAREQQGDQFGQSLAEEKRQYNLTNSLSRDQLGLEKDKLAETARQFDRPYDERTAQQLGEEEFYGKENAAERDLKWRIALLNKGDGSEDDKKKSEMLYQAFDTALYSKRMGSLSDGTVDWALADQSKDEIMAAWEKEYRGMLADEGYGAQDINRIVNEDRVRVDEWFQEISAPELTDTRDGGSFEYKAPLGDLPAKAFQFGQSLREPNPPAIVTPDPVSGAYPSAITSTEKEAYDKLINFAKSQPGNQKVQDLIKMIELPGELTRDQWKEVENALRVINVESEPMATPTEDQGDITEKFKSFLNRINPFGRK